MPLHCHQRTERERSLLTFLKHQKSFLALPAVRVCKSLGPTCMPPGNDAIAGRGLKPPLQVIFFAGHWNCSLHLPCPPHGEAVLCLCAAHFWAMVCYYSVFLLGAGFMAVQYFSYVRAQYIDSMSRVSHSRRMIDAH
jgi:hypothetical protein